MTQPADISRGFGFMPDRGLSIVRAQACWVWDAEGRRRLDAGGVNFGTMNVGHAHPRVVQAVVDSATNGPSHVAQSFSTPSRARLVEGVLAFAGPWAERAFLSNSGTEAVETAIKIAMAATGRPGIVAFDGGFHGRSLGALGVTSSEAYRAPFAKRLGATTFIPFGDAAAAEAAIGPDTAAVIVEPIQGEAGVRVPEPGFLSKLRAITDAQDVMLIVDEVQTGLGRTGADLAIHAEDVVPDLLCLAKSLAAGYPLGATIARDGIGPFPPGLHGSTFGGSPVACAAANAVLSIMADEGLAEHAARRGARFREALSSIDDPLVRDVRGRGLIVGMELASRVTPVLQALQRRDVLALPAGVNVLRFLPPLVIDDDQLDAIASAVAASLAEVRARYAEAPA